MISVSEKSDRVFAAAGESHAFQANDDLDQATVSGSGFSKLARMNSAKSEAS